MRVLAYVPDWPGGRKVHARETAEIISRCCRVEVLDNPEHFFSEQWEEARRRFDERRDPESGDILLLVMADVWPPMDFPEMYADMVRLMESGVGVYAPEVEDCSWVYDKSALPEVEPGVHEVPCTDMLIWAVRADVLSGVQFCDPVVNKFGWGIDFAVNASARSLGLKVVRDYRFVARHPVSRGYDSTAAMAMMRAWVDSMPLDHRSAVLDEMSRVGLKL